MVSRKAAGWLSAAAFVLTLYLAHRQMVLALPGLNALGRLVTTLVAAKVLGDALEQLWRPRRPTFYYADYLAGWLHYGVLGLVGAGGFSLAGAVVERPVATFPLALGIYLVWRLTRPDR